MTKLALIVLLLALPARADESLGEILVRAPQAPEDIRELPAFVEVIRPQDHRGQWRTTEELLSHVAGVSVRSFGGLGQMSTVSIRGSSSDQVAVFLDGVRLNPPQGGGVDFSTIPLEHIERIEIIRGGGSARFGEAAMGGVVNIISRRSEPQPRTSAMVSLGSQSTVRASAEHSRPWPHDPSGGLVAALSLMTSQGDFAYIDDNGTTFDDSDDRARLRQNNAFTSVGGLLKGRFTLPGGELAVTSETTFADRGSPGMVTFPSPEAWTQDFREVLHLGLTMNDMATPGLNLEAALTGHLAHAAFGDPEGDQTGVASESHQTAVTTGASLGLDYYWGTHQVLGAHMEGAYDRLIDPTLSGPDRWRGAVSARDEVILLDDMLVILPAIRLDLVTGEAPQVSPKLGLRYQPLKELTIKANGGRSYRAPSFTELYVDQGLVVGNPDLLAETAWSVDGGAILTLPYIAVEAAYYHRWASDLIEYMLISGFQFKPHNVGEARIHGVEATVRARPLKQWGLTGAYTLTLATDATGLPNRDGNQIPGRPVHSVSIKTDVHLEPVRVFAEYLFVSGNFVTQANTKLLDPRHLVNLGVQIVAEGVLTFTLEAKNLLDSRVVDVRGFPLPGLMLFGSVGVEI